MALIPTVSRVLCWLFWYFGGPGNPETFLGLVREILKVLRALLTATEVCCGDVDARLRQLACPCYLGDNSYGAIGATVDIMDRPAMLRLDLEF